MPFASSEVDFDKAIKEAKEKGFSAVWFDEGSGEPNSIYVINKKDLLKSKPTQYSTAKKKDKSGFNNVDWDRLKELGKTTNMKEAGYFAPDGSMVDLSGKKEGGRSGVRHLDHREVGGTIGMQELGAAGYVRVDLNSGVIDIHKTPTPKQYGLIASMAEKSLEGFTVELEDGLGEYKDEPGGMGYYRQAGRSFYRQ